MNIKHELRDMKRLMQSVPATVVAFFTVSVILMNLLAGKEVQTGISWLALDCGITVSWLSFLCMDMITKRFGARAAIQLSFFASAMNLFVCAIFKLVSMVPGNWAEFYTFEADMVNQALDNTIGGTWYILMGSTVAFITSSIVNALINAGLGKAFDHSTFTGYAVRSYVSTLIAQFVDNMVFALIVSHTFFGWTMTQCVFCSATGCVVELICEVVFSPVGYKVCKGWERDGVGAGYLEGAR